MSPRGPNKSVIRLVQPVVDKTEALEVIDDLRAAVERGEVKAFACVAIAPDHSTRMWRSCTRPTTFLEIIGAAYHLLHNLENE